MQDPASTKTLNGSRGLLLALLVTVTAAGAVLIFLLSKALLIDQDFTGSVYENSIPRALAGFFLLAFPFIYQRLSGKRRASFSHLPGEPVAFDTYTLPAYITLAQGVLVAFAVAGIGIFLVWLIGMVSGFFLTRAIPLLNWIILPVALYYLGFWVGARNSQKPLITAAAVALGYVLLEWLAALLLRIESPLRSTLTLVLFLVVCTVAALMGAWKGRRRRLSRYVDFLLKHIPERDRQAVVDHVYEEAMQRTTHPDGITGEEGNTRREYPPVQTQPAPDSDPQAQPSAPPRA